MEKVKLSDYHENYASQILIEEHTVGGIRDEADFDIIRYHCYKTLVFTKNFIEAFEGTDEEKAGFLQKIFDDLQKFSVKKREELTPEEEAKEVVKDMGIE